VLCCIGQGSGVHPIPLNCHEHLGRTGRLACLSVGQAVSPNTAYFSSWGGQSRPQPPFQAAGPAGKPVRGQDCRAGLPAPQLALTCV
jgi:hypothetical protein